MGELELFEQKFKVDPQTGCWLWTASCNPYGYGRFWNRDHKQVGAHRAAYEFYIGSIPSQMQIDHICRIRHCVNPVHLRLVTREENLRAEGSLAFSTAKFTPTTRCKNGHKFSETNKRIYAKQNVACEMCRV